MEDFADLFNQQGMQGYDSSKDEDEITDFVDTKHKGRIEAQFDFHGYKREDAVRELERFIMNCRRVRYRKVLLIVGKGLHSPGGVSPVRLSIERKLELMIASGTISNYRMAKGKQGGAGAFIVEI